MMLGNALIAAMSGQKRGPYWRVLITSSFRDGFTAGGMAELEFREIVGGPDAATGGTPSADSTSAGYIASNAFDGNTATDWISGSGAFPHWVQYEFPNHITIRQISITASAESLLRLYAPEDFQVQFSADGTFWADALTVTGEAEWTAGETRTFTL